MFARAFPTLQPRSELEWMSKNLLPTESIDDDIRFCLSLCALVHAQRERELVAEQKVEFIVRRGEEVRRTNSPYYSLVDRTVHASKLFVGAWTDVTDKKQLRQLDILLGIMDFIDDTCPAGHMAKLASDLPATHAAWLKSYLELNISAEWAHRLAAPLEINFPLPVDRVPASRHINWELHRAVHDATQLYYSGRYKDAHRAFSAIDATAHMWIPDKWIVAFLKPGALRAYVDLPTKIITSTTNDASSSSSSSSSSGEKDDDKGGSRKRRGVSPLATAVEFK